MSDIARDVDGNYQKDDRTTRVVMNFDPVDSKININWDGYGLEYMILRKTGDTYKSIFKNII